MCEMTHRSCRDGDLGVHRLAIRDERRDAGKVQRMVLAAPPRPGDRPQSLDAAACELADATGPKPFVAEERKRIPQPRRERRQRRIRVGRVLMQEVDPQPGRHLAPRG